MIKNVIGCKDQNGGDLGACSTCGYVYGSDDCFDFLDYHLRIIIVEE